MPGRTTQIRPLPNHLKSGHFFLPDLKCKFCGRSWASLRSETKLKCKPRDPEHATALQEHRRVTGLAQASCRRTRAKKKETREREKEARWAALACQL